MISKELPWSTLKKYDTPTPIQFTVYSLFNNQTNAVYVGGGGEDAKVGDHLCNKMAKMTKISVLR